MPRAQNRAMLYHFGDQPMTKMIVFLCYISSGQCDWLPWTDSLNGPTTGSPIIYETKDKCTAAGDWLLKNHSGAYPNRPPGYYIRQYRCEPS